MRGPSGAPASSRIRLLASATSTRALDLMREDLELPPLSSLLEAIGRCLRAPTD